MIFTCKQKNTDTGNVIITIIEHNITVKNSNNDFAISFQNSKRIRQCHAYVKRYFDCFLKIKCYHGHLKPYRQIFSFCFSARLWLGSTIKAAELKYYK